VAYPDWPKPDNSVSVANNEHFSTQLLWNFLGGEKFADFFFAVQPQRGKSVSSPPKTNQQRQFDFVKIKPLNQIVFFRLEFFDIYIFSGKNGCLYAATCEFRLAGDCQRAGFCTLAGVAALLSATGKN